MSHDTFHQNNKIFTLCFFFSFCFWIDIHLSIYSKEGVLLKGSVKQISLDLTNHQPNIHSFPFYPKESSLTTTSEFNFSVSIEHPTPNLKLVVFELVIWPTLLILHMKTLLLFTAPRTKAEG